MHATKDGEVVKVHVYGNVFNSGFDMTRFLRAKGIDATMFLDDADGPLKLDAPYSDSPDGLPSWIRRFLGKPSLLLPGPETRQLIREFSCCDVALVNGFGPILASLARVPFVFFSLGFDLNILDFRLQSKAVVRSRPRWAVPRHLAGLVTHSMAQKAALANAQRVLVMMGYQIRPYVEKYGLAAKMTKARMAWDTDRHCPDTAGADLRARYATHDVVLFMVARHEWKCVWNDLKGNDRFIRAYARFVRTKRPSALLVMIEKGVDVQASRDLVEELGIADQVEWVREMTREAVRGYESLPNCVVVDQFFHAEWYRKFPTDCERALCGLGFAGLEALSAGRPLITMFSDEAFYNGESPPILSASTEDEIYERLVQVDKMSAEERRILGEAGRAFVRKWHDWRNATQLYIDALEDAVRAVNCGLP